ARAADRDGEERIRRFARSPEVPYLVTGASGGLGSALVERLRNETHPIRVMVRQLPERPEDGLPGVEYVRGDLADPDAVDRAVRAGATSGWATARCRCRWCTSTTWSTRWSWPPRATCTAAR